MSIFIAAAASWFYATRCGDVFLAAALMVKNEVSTVSITLESLARHNISRVFVYDTGSTDGTQTLCRSRAAELGLELFLREGAFVDFATSRNALLAWAESRSEWLLLLDSGEEITAPIADALSRTADSVCGFHIMQQWGQSTFYNVRLIRNNGVWRYEFPVHEYLHKETACETLDWSDDLRITQNRAVTGHSSYARWHRDVDVLLSVLEYDPENPRAAFYLAQTYAQLGQFKNAIGAYFTRYGIVNRGWWEEREVALYQIVLCHLNLNQTTQANKWAARLYDRHSRIEGIVEVAQRFADTQQFLICYALAQLACKEPKPKRHLFFNSHTYDHQRWALRDQCLKSL